MKDIYKNFIIGRVTPFLLVFYFLVLFLLFLAETLPALGLQEHIRATNQVLLLLVLLVLPVVIIGMSRFVQSLTVKISGQELHLEMSEIKQDVELKVGKVETSLNRQVSTAEQALWPILAGFDFHSDTRLSGSRKKLIIGSKLDPSHMFFTQLLAQTIEKFIPDTECEIRYPNGGSLRNFADVKFRWIDMYIDFTGTCCQYFNINHQGKVQQQIIDELNEYGAHIGLKWLQPLGASEDYCLVMAPKAAETHQISNLADLKIHAHKLVLSADPEFINRKDLYLGLRNYGIEFKEVIPCHITERYGLLESGEASVFVGYETDPQVFNKEVVRLQDPEQFFPPYAGLPLVSQSALDKVPGLEKVLNSLHNIMTTEDLNSIVVGLGKANNHPLFAAGKAKELVAKLPPVVSVSSG